MRFLLLFCLVFCCHGTLKAQQWYEGVWVFDANKTRWSNPGMTAYDTESVKAGFDKWAGHVTINSKRIKGRKIKAGVPYVIKWQSGNAVGLEARGAVVEMVKSFQPGMKNTSLQCTAVRLSHNSMYFEVPSMKTIRMYMRRVQ